MNDSNTKHFNILKQMKMKKRNSPRKPKYTNTNFLQSKFNMKKIMKTMKSKPEWNSKQNRISKYENYIADRWIEKS